MACDIVLAHEQASFIQAFSKIGLIPDSGGTYLLPRLIGSQKALALMMTGDKVSAAEAERMNMIYKAVPAEDYDQVTNAFISNLASMPTKALALTKQAINHVEDLQGKRAGMEAAFAWHHFSHAHNDLVSGDKLGGFDAKAMAAANKEQDKS